MSQGVYRWLMTALMVLALLGAWTVARDIRAIREDVRSIVEAR